MSQLINFETERKSLIDLVINELRDNDSPCEYGVCTWELLIQLLDFILTFMPVDMCKLVCSYVFNNESTTYKCRIHPPYYKLNYIGKYILSTKNDDIYFNIYQDGSCRIKLLKNYDVDFTLLSVLHKPNISWYKWFKYDNKENKTLLFNSDNYHEKLKKLYPKKQKQYEKIIEVINNAKCESGVNDLSNLYSFVSHCDGSNSCLGDPCCAHTFVDKQYLEQLFDALSKFSFVHPIFLDKKLFSITKLSKILTPSYIC